MYKIYCIAFLVFGFFKPAFAQEPFDVKWSQEFDNGKLLFQADYIGQDDKGYMTVSENLHSQLSMGDQTAVFNKINGQGKLIVQTNLVIKFKENEVAYLKAVNLKGKKYLFSTFWDKKENDKYLLASTISNEGIADAAPKVLFKCHVGNSKRKTDIKLNLSKDSTKVVVQIDDEEDKGQNKKFVYRVFDDQLKELWSVDLDCSYLADNYFDKEFFLTSKNILGVVGRIRKVGDEKPRVFFYSVKIHQFETKKTEEYLPQAGNAFLWGVKAEESQDGNLWLGGLYGKENKRDWYSVDGYADGVFLNKYDFAAKKEVIQKQYPFTPALKANIVPEEKANSGEAVLWGYKMDKIILRKDGSIILLVPKQYLWADTPPIKISMKSPSISAPYSQDASANGKNYYYLKDLIVVSLNPKAELEWFNCVPMRFQAGNDITRLRFFSYVFGMIDKDLYFIYNESEDNVRYTKVMEYRAIADPRGDYTAFIKMDKLGKMTKTRVLINTDKKNMTYLEPAVSLPITKDFWIISSSDFDIKQTKLGILKFK
ncbi:MAG: hypothetical protein K0R51_364 [Cytophagaceae bacterium]|jgi:hypothetical protein|nr:hypothetical protein [Cytophagaceae bacterium]